MKNFPVVATLESANKNIRCQCVNCCPMEMLGAPVETDYPVGRGHWRMTCGRCGASIWFDLAPVDHLAPLREIYAHFTPRSA